MAMAALRSKTIFAQLLLTTLFAINSVAQQPEQPAAALTIDEIVHRLVEMNARRAQALHSYESNRVYRVKYRGFPGDRDAEMTVALKYSAPGTKEFAVKSSTGSKLIIDRVFKKLIESEQEALTPEMQKRTALNTENYEFALAGTDTTSLGPAYILTVTPTRKDKFLYRGRIWVDATDFAVVRIEAEPAKNPSFWTKVSGIQQQYARVGEFWLPKSNRSTSSIRLGGKAELAIDYSDYRVTSAAPVQKPFGTSTTAASDERGERASPR